MRNSIYTIVICVFVGSAFSQSIKGARATGLGGAYAALSDDPLALYWNPAGMGVYNCGGVIAGYSPLYLGFCSDNLQNIYAGIIIHTPQKLSYGVSWEAFTSNIYSRNDISISVCYPMFEFVSIGVRGKFYYMSLDESNFEYDSQLDIVQDPLFVDRGTRKIAYGADFGCILLPLKDLSIGLYMQNVLIPNFHLGDESTSEDIKLHAGIAYELLRDYVFSIEGAYRDKPVANENFKYYMGFETIQFDRILSLRIGYNKESVTSGMGISTKPMQLAQINRRPMLLKFSFNYAFMYPLSKIGFENSYTHCIDVSATWTCNENAIK